MKITVNIPSYKRPYVKTLEYIKDANVYVCETEAEEYRKQNKNGNIIAMPKGVQGNVSRARNYILESEYNKGADAVCLMDDDMEGIYNWENRGTFGYEKRKIEEGTFYEWLETNTILCDEFGFKLWGVNLNSDARSYRQYTPISTNAVILGPFGVHIKSKTRYDESIPLKEDYDIALQHLKEYRGILRINSCFYACKQSENAGGCASIRNYKREKENFDRLRKKWGSEIIQNDKGSKKEFDYNPIIKVPIKGV